MPPRPDYPPGSMRDPWVLPGLAALVVFSLVALYLYASAPQSASEVRSAGWVAVSPDAFTPRVARARERVQAALRARAAGDTAGALARYAEAEEEAWSARERAADTAQAAVATELWASAILDRAELMLVSGATPWYRGDNDQLLREALAAARRAQSVPIAPATRQRAAALVTRIERQLRPGPLEWIPR
ncbi:MAG TPA: hypothetical protein VHG91_05205 [Longimicrobium sp.]|nr:hypothetical protein [Longimicrobium sp.]